MQDLHFIAVESMNLGIGGGAVTDILAAVHRFIASRPADAERIQLTFPQATTEGHHRHLGRRAAIFGSKAALDTFWLLNREDIEQTCMALGPADTVVRSLEQLQREQPQAILGFARYNRMRQPSKAKMMARKAAHFAEKGYSIDQRQLEEWADKRREEMKHVVEHITYFSKTTREKVVLKVSVHKEAAQAPKFDSSEVNGFGLSSTNVLPILKL